MRDENYKDDPKVQDYVHTWDDIIHNISYSSRDMVLLLADGRFTMRENGKLVQTNIGDAHRYCEATGKGWSAYWSLSPRYVEISDGELGLDFNHKALQAALRSNVY